MSIINPDIKSAILSRLHTENVENPVDIIKASLDKKPPRGAPQPEQPAPESKAVLPESFEMPEPKFGSVEPVISTDEVNNEQSDSDQSDDIPEEAASPEQQGVEDKKEEKKISNNAKLRHALNRIKEEKTTLEQTYNTLKEEHEAYSKGEKLPEPIQSRLTELEKYEKLHAFKMSREYNDHYVRPIEELEHQAASLSQEYQVDPRVLNEALQIDNKKARNAFLARHFDPVGALEMTGMLDKLINAYDARDFAEQNAEEELNRLRMSSQEADKQRRLQAAKRIEKIGVQGWGAALNELQGSQKFPELTLMEGNEQHNQFVRPILQSASQEVAKFMKFLTESGVENVPEEISKTISKWALLSHASSIMSRSRDAFGQKVDEIVQSSKRLTPLIRPQIGGGQANGAGAPQPQLKSGMTAAKELTRKMGM